MNKPLIILDLRKFNLYEKTLEKIKNKTKTLTFEPYFKRNKQLQFTAILIHLSKCQKKSNLRTYGDYILYSLCYN